jgi:hypothetical protein
MRAVQIPRFGGPEVLGAAGINVADTHRRQSWEALGFPPATSA